MARKIVPQRNTRTNSTRRTTGRESTSKTTSSAYRTSDPDRMVVERENRRDRLNRTERRNRLNRDDDNDRSPLAVISLVLGILSLLFLFVGGFSLILAVAAIIVGSMALPRIRKERLEGRAMAIWGIILGVVTIVLFVIFIIIIGTIGLAIIESLVD